MSFDRLAAHYDWMEAVTGGGVLQRARTAWLDELAGCRRVLSAGEGHGRFAAAFCARYPEAELTCVDASARMLEHAKRRVSAGGHICWLNVSLLDWAPAQADFDAVVTCFFLDCFGTEDLAAVVRKLSALAAARAMWVNVDFSMPPRGPARWRAAAIHGMMYRFFRAVTRISARRLTPPDAMLKDGGFKLAKRREFDWSLLRADVWRRTGPSDNQQSTIAVRRSAFCRKSSIWKPSAPLPARGR